MVLNTLNGNYSLCLHNVYTMFTQCLHNVYTMFTQCLHNVYIFRHLGFSFLTFALPLWVVESQKTL